MKMDVLEIEVQFTETTVEKLESIQYSIHWMLDGSDPESSPISPEEVLRELQDVVDVLVGHRYGEDTTT